jgi:UDP-3-O-[3-hydroxymyristoyl] glucosamine N-acyltransferase
MQSLLNWINLKSEQVKMEVSLQQLAELVAGELEGDAQRRVTGVAGIREAGNNEVTFLANPKYIRDLECTHAGAVIMAPAVQGDWVESLRAKGISMILVEDPYFAFAQVLQFFHAQPYRPLGISREASIGKDVQLGKDLSIHPFVRIEDRVKLGDRVTLYPGTFVGEGSEIGDDCLIYPNVTIREKTQIGKRVILHSGTVIGSDGYGFATRQGKHHKIPQVGTVVIEDDVELGANVTVDRAALGKTVIKRGTKVDNLVQIAHNVVVGEDCLIVAQAGISGSTQLGHHVILAGQVGVIGHLKIGDGVRVGAQSGVVKDVEPGQTVSGTYTMPHNKWLRLQAVLPELPEMVKQIRELEKKVETLEKTLKKREKIHD